MCQCYCYCLVCYHLRDFSLPLLLGSEGKFHIFPVVTLFQLLKTTFNAQPCRSTSSSLKSLKRGCIKMMPQQICGSCEDNFFLRNSFLFALHFLHFDPNHLIVCVSFLLLNWIAFVLGFARSRNSRQLEPRTEELCNHC